MNKRIEWWVIITITSIIGIGFIAFSWWAIHDSIEANVIKAPEQTQETAKFTPANIALDEYLKVPGSIVDIVSTPVDNDQRLFLVDQAGYIYMAKDDKVIEEPFLNVSDSVLNEGERGLLSLAFHPDYAKNGLVYINVVEAKDGTAGRNVIYEYKVSDDANKLDATSQRLVLSYDQPFGNHNGGDMVFDSNGNLYIGSGDGGSGGDPLENGQNTNTLLGKILRIDPLQAGQFSYTIPEGNPFLNKADTKPEIWAYGLRNPWRLSIDEPTNQLYIGEVGQGGFEEINRVSLDAGGANFGWRCYEGPQKFSFDGCDDATNTYVEPYIYYQHEGSQCTGSVVGGFVYRGSQYADLAGQYIYADYCTSKIYLAASEGQPQGTIVLRHVDKITTFGEDSNHELYVSQVIDGDSVISKIVVQ